MVCPEMDVPDMGLKEAFATLEIEVGSSFDKARAAYRRLCIVWHPDRFQDGELPFTNRQWRSRQGIPANESSTEESDDAHNRQDDLADL